jgi:deoxycytidine triphosphate deaminase
MWLVSGLYDSGFKGNIGAVLHTGTAYATIEVGVRIGQIMFIESKSVGTYAGGYNTADGQHWKDKATIVEGTKEVTLEVTNTGFRQWSDKDPFDGAH